MIFVVSHGLHTHNSTWCNLALLGVYAGVITFIAWIETFQSIMDVLPFVKNGCTCSQVGLSPAVLHKQVLKSCCF